jgi:sphingomyelin phosphodiesterase acid-like 3
MLHQLKIIVYFFSALTITSVFFSCEGFAARPNFLPAASTPSFVSVTDIHFNPFYTCDKKNKNCPLMNKLLVAPVAEWPSLFNQYDTQPAQYKDDTNYVLFKSTLNELKKIHRQQHLPFVLVLGDFLSHDYKKNYQYYTGDLSDKGAQRFVDKTMQFITTELAATFPNTNVYMVVGNNDNYEEHYTSQPEFYKNIAPIWSTLIQNKESRAKMEKEFAQGGYYALDINSTLRLIVLNTTFFSTRGVGMDQEAQRELNWLEKQLALLNHTQSKVLIALHIPNLARVSISQDIPVAALGLWQPRYIEQFLHLLKSSAPHIMAVLPAHLHVDWAQLLQFNGGNDVVISATPSISPVVGNNPGFKVYYYDPKNLIIKDYLTYFYPLQEGKWKFEYAFNQTYQAGCKVCTLESGLKQLSKSSLHLKEYKKFYSVNREAPIFSNLIYPAPACNLHDLNYAEYMQCVTK